MTRTSALSIRVPPSRWNSRSWSTRRNFACTAGLISPTHPRTTFTRPPSLGLELRREASDPGFEADGPFLGCGAPALFLGQALVGERQGHQVGDAPPRWHVRFRVGIRRA